ncbi:MAG: hypothetical protein IKB86_03875 [Clostridia bacterium]|nr:hypothetical protein [Clostridia bacterium]
MFNQHKQIISIALVLLTAFIGLYVAFGSGEFAQNVKYAVEMSLEEDFKIKESLGQVFLAQKNQDSQQVSGSATVLTLKRPMEIEPELIDYLGDKALKFNCEKYAAVSSSGAGKIETVENNRITVRHYDGKLSIYSNVGSLVRAGDTVEQGECIGFAKEDVIFRLSENCVFLNPLDYFVA